MTPTDTSAVLFTWPVRIYWEDTDAGGVVYHASYLRFLERARTEWLRSLGVQQSRIKEDSGLAFLVRETGDREATTDLTANPKLGQNPGW